jgi:hypothetical protein
MQDIEPYQRWRDEYDSSSDKKSPFFGRTYEEEFYTQKIYNYFIHPYWDDFGSPTLYMKILYADYSIGFAIFELFGEWNDGVTNDIMYLKRDVVDQLIKEGISKFILISEGVLNFHCSDDCYYEEWYDDIKEYGGWICLLNTYHHVEEEMREVHLEYYLSLGERFNEINWRAMHPKMLYRKIENLILKPLPEGRWDEEEE